MRIDLIIESRNVFTGVGDVARPAAIAVAGDRIVAVGSREDVRAFALEANAGGGAPEVRDFGDALVVPGFHDSHLHFFHSAVYSSPLATMFLGESETDCVARMQAFAKDRPNGWLLAQGWREYRWNPPVLPSKRSLDEAFPTRPVALYSGDAHTLWLNSAALDELGLTRDSVPPAGGSYDRDETGELTGIVREAAAMELMPQIMGSFTDEEVADAYRGFFARLAENGVTSVCDMSLMAHPGLDFIRDDVHASLLERGELLSGPEGAKLDQDALRSFQLMTSKPFIFVFNMDAAEMDNEEMKDELRSLVAPAEAIFLDAQFEAELVELDDEDAREMLAESGQDESGLDKLARVGFDTLGLQTYLTAGEKEARAWTIHKGDTAPKAAGVIHTDFEKGFIKAEVVSYDDLDEAGSMAAAKAAAAS